MNAIPATYVANLALHTFILAVFAAGLTRCFKNPAARSLVALIGLLAVVPAALRLPAWDARPSPVSAAPISML